MTNRSFTTRLARASAGALLALAAASAGAWPDKPVKFIHAYPGAPVDVVIRYIADRLAVQWKQPVVVDTKPGASEIIAGDTVAKAAPDGYTLFFGTEANFSNNQFLFSKLPFDPQADLAPVMLVCEVPYTLIVRGDFPADNLKDFLAEVKKPGQGYKYASSGVGSPNHMSMEKLRNTLGFDMLHVPYKFGPQLMQDLLGGRVDAFIGGAQISTPYLATKKLKVLGISGNARLPVLPDVPTFTESGRPDVRIGTYVGVAAPRGTPPAVLDRIQADLRAVLQTADFQKAVGDPAGFACNGSTRQEFTDYLATRRREAGAQIRALGIKLD